MVLLRAIPTETDGSAAESPQDPPADFPLLYDRYKRLVRGVLFKLCGGNDLDDLVQEAFLRIWKGVPGFDRRSSFRTWVYAILTHVAADHFRKKGRRLALAPGDPDTHPASPNNDPSANRDLVRQALARLTEEHRIALILHLYEGLSLEEIAVVTQTKTGTVKSRLHYARLAVTEYLESQGVKL
jgi:RNA polymerase sigma-70 factor, ECF subfamily